jgi:hypothetical protein
MLNHKASCHGYKALKLNLLDPGLCHRLDTSPAVEVDAGFMKVECISTNSMERIPYWDANSH